MLLTTLGCILALRSAAEVSDGADTLSLVQARAASVARTDDDVAADNFDADMDAAEEDDFDADMDDEDGAPIDKGAINKADCPWKCSSMTFGWGKKCQWSECKPCDMCEKYGKGLECSKSCYKKKQTGDFRQPWTKKCPKAFCRGCDECASYTTTTTTAKLDPCMWSCREMPYSWGKKCEWEQCAQCEQCDDWAKNKACKDTCYKGGKGWKEKCQRADCGSCSECEELFKSEKKPDFDATPSPTSNCEDSCVDQYDRLAAKGRSDLAKKKTCAKARCESCDFCA
jgi:hypothetical protein